MPSHTSYRLGGWQASPILTYSCACTQHDHSLVLDSRFGRALAMQHRSFLHDHTLTRRFRDVACYGEFAAPPLACAQRNTKALGDPKASSGHSAEAWGIWRVDPGPRGVRLHNYDKLAANGGACHCIQDHDALLHHHFRGCSFSDIDETCVRLHGHGIC
jgi:hypothetical protein